MTEASKPQRHVCILGMGPSVAEYMAITRQLGGRSSFCDEVWAINALGNVFDCDMVFHMDDVRIQEIRAAARPESNIAAMLRWLKTTKTPVMTGRAHPDYPALIEFPLEDVINANPCGYFNSTAAYAVAYAIHTGATKITVFGNDFTYPDAHHAERGRACVEFWLGIATARGIALAVPRHTSLLDALYPLQERFYGYDTFELGVSRKEGRIVFDFKERETWPTAEQMEERYDHNQHPNPLVEVAANASDAAPACAA